MTVLGASFGSAKGKPRRPARKRLSGAGKGLKPGNFTGSPNRPTGEPLTGSGGRSKKFRTLRKNLRFGVDGDGEAVRQFASRVAAASLAPLTA